MEGMAPAGRAGEDRQWAAMQESKEMVDMQQGLQVEVGMKEEEMEGRKQLACKGMMVVAECCT